MITVSRATKDDLPAIMALSATYGHKLIVTKEHLNSRDISLQARDSETGALIGFAWGGMMANNTIMYIDKVMVHPNYARKGVCQLLYKELFRRGVRRGAKQGIGTIRRDKWHNQSAMNALKMAFSADPLPHTFVCGDANHIQSELSLLGVA